MKILVCTDGSRVSRKALEEAVKLTGGCSIHQVTAIYVQDENLMMPFEEHGYQTKKDYEKYLEMKKGEGKKILAEAEKFFLEKGIEAKTLFKIGHPAMTIAAVAADGGYDMIVIGSRGHGGLKRIFLGSVSNAVLLEARTSVLVVK